MRKKIINLWTTLKGNQTMKTYIVYAECVILETLEIEARNENEALELAGFAKNEAWQTKQDIDWRIITAQEITE